MAKDTPETVSGRNRSTKVTSSSDVMGSNIEKTLIKTLETEQKRVDKDRSKRQLDSVKNQAKQMAKLGLDFNKLDEKEKIKIIKNLNKIEQIEKMKNLADYNKKSLELQKEYNRLILEAGSGASLKERVGASFKETMGNIGQQFTMGGMLKSAQRLFDNLTQQFSSIMSEYAKFQIGINTRLQGTDRTFTGMSEMIKNNIGITPFVKTQTMFENLNKLTELGIVYNLEQRAFLESIAEKISTTFDATNGTLLRLVRLQQSDSTAARLGLETSLTQYLNRMFEDSSYLNRNFDMVSDALIEATSQLNTETTVQFEYIVQKWLGSLSSVGLSDSTVTSLAQAIGYLGSGNIAGLEGMSGMRNLLIMAASRSGNLNYADMLSQGLDSSQTNELLRNVVEYIQQIGSTDNRVIQSQYASLFGITLSDLTAAKNLRASLDDIARSTLDYSGAINELVTSMSTMGSRMSIATKMDTLWENLQYNLATNIADSPFLYGAWKVTDMIQSLTGGIQIPFVTAMGTGVDVRTSVENLMKLGIVGAGTFGLIGSLMSGLSNSMDTAKMLTSMSIGLGEPGRSSFGQGLDSYLQEEQRRGGPLNKFAPKGARRDTSGSTFVGTTSGSDIQASTLAQSEKDAQQKLNQRQQETVDYVKMTAEYLTNTFNPKMDAVVMMMAKVASYNLSTATGEAFSDKDLSSMMLGKTTGIVVSDSDKSDERMTVISSIATDVSSIARMLESGISVNLGSVLGTTQTPDGFTT
jgi:uncharacterized protein YciW